MAGLFDLTPDPESHIPTEEAEIPEQARAFASEIIGSVEYRTSLRNRIARGELAPAVETLLLHYCFGKPTERREVTFADQDLSKLTLEELKKRSEENLRNIQAVQAIEQVKPTVM